MATASLLCLLGLLCLSASEPLLLTSQSFRETVTSGKPCFVMFFAPWCGHCKRLGPTWIELATKYSSSSSRITIAKVDCTTDTDVCSDEGVRGYPTLKLFVDDKATQYTGPRDLGSLTDFVEQQIQTKEGDRSSLVELNDNSFQSFILKDSLHFVMMYAPWCGHCKQLSPVWEELANFYKSYKYVHISKVDCTKNKATCDRYRVTSYPTLLLIQNGALVERYSGDRSLSSLISFVDSSASPQEKPPMSPLLLTEDNFKDTIKEGVTFVKFFAPWCGHCKALSPTWQQLAELLHSTTHTTVAKVDCTEQKQLCDTHDVSGYPTLVLFVDGDRRKEYRGTRDLASMQQFIDDNSY